MDYNPPFGSGSPNAPYVDRNTPNAVQGSKVPAAAIELPQREIVNVIKSAGITPDNADRTQLLQALQYYFRQPRIYPDVLTSNGRMGIFSPATGTVRVPANVEWLMNGHQHFKSVQTDFATLASKAYFLRWDADNGFRLIQLNSAYLGAGAETDDDFDTTYSDMLVAKVVTNGSNVATITDLSNKSRLALSDIITGGDVHHSGANGASFTLQRTLNWSRTPDDYSLVTAFASVSAPPTATDFNICAADADREALVGAATVFPINRYEFNGILLYDSATAVKMLLSARA